MLSPNSVRCPKCNARTCRILFWIISYSNSNRKQHTCTHTHTRAHASKTWQAPQMPSRIPIMALACLLHIKSYGNYQKKDSHLGFCFSSHYEDVQSKQPKKHVCVNLAVKILLPKPTVRVVNKIHLKRVCAKEIWWGMCVCVFVCEREVCAYMRKCTYI